MHLENKFLFIGKAFLVIFLIINTVNLIPLDLVEIHPPAKIPAIFISPFEVNEFSVL